MFDFLSFLILFCIGKIEGERTTYSIFHLLNGKKSSQTIQDAHLFHLSNLFQTFPRLKRLDYDEMIINLEKMKLIYAIKNERCVLSDKGKTQLDEYMNQYPIPIHLKGWEYHFIQEDFWKRLSLLVQVCSNLINYETSYMPIQNDWKVSNWLKATLPKFRKNRSELASDLLDELTNCFLGENMIKPETVVLRLSGYKKVGLTQNQAAEWMKMDPSNFQLEFLNTIHYMINKINSNHIEYPILHLLIDGFHHPVVLTNSSLVTNQYLNSGYSIEDIAAIRNLKRNTIEDHVVEIALNDDNFNLAPFVNSDIVDQIKESIKKLSSKQLKIIRQDLNESVSYFQIRLVLAKLGDKE